MRSVEFAHRRVDDIARERRRRDFQNRHFGKIDLRRGRTENGIICHRVRQHLLPFIQEAKVSGGAEQLQIPAGEIGGVVIEEKLLLGRARLPVRADAPDVAVPHHAEVKAMGAFEDRSRLQRDLLRERERIGINAEHPVVVGPDHASVRAGGNAEIAAARIDRRAVRKILSEYKDPRIGSKIQEPVPVDRHGPDNIVLAEILQQRFADLRLSVRSANAKQMNVQESVRPVLDRGDEFAVPDHPGQDCSLGKVKRDLRENFCGAALHQRPDPIV